MHGNNKHPHRHHQKQQGSPSRPVAALALAGVLLASFVAIMPAGEQLLLQQWAYAQPAITIDGAGATFPFPLIDTWRVEYKKVRPDVNLNYASIGSGGGIKQFTTKTVDFGASDAPLTEGQREALPSTAVHIPETVGSVVAAYNIPGISQKGMKLTGPILADIFLGKVKTWDHPSIKALNPDMPLPSREIVVIRRSDGSGTTFVWTDYLSSVSPEWKEKVGKGTSVPWPTGRGAPGNEGVANSIKGTPYTIGYVELSYALATKMAFAHLQNREGNFIEPTLESTRAAVAASAAQLPAGDASWAAVSLVDAPGKDSYPIASFSYLLLYKEMSANPKVDSEAKARAIVDFIAWATSPVGQRYAEKLAYVPLPDDVVKLNQKTLATLTFKGKQLYTAAAPAAPVAAAQPPLQQQEQQRPQPNDGKGQAPGSSAKLKVAASMRASTGAMSVLLKNPLGSDAQVNQFEVTLSEGFGQISAVRAPKGWTCEFDGDTAVFSTEGSPVKAGKSGLFKITAAAKSAAAAADAKIIEWEAHGSTGSGSDGDLMSARGSAKVRVR